MQASQILLCEFEEAHEVREIKKYKDSAQTVLKKRFDLCRHRVGNSLLCFFKNKPKKAAKFERPLLITFIKT